MVGDHQNIATLGRNLGHGWALAGITVTVCAKDHEYSTLGNFAHGGERVQKRVWAVAEIHVYVWTRIFRNAFGSTRKVGIYAVVGTAGLR